MNKRQTGIYERWLASNNLNLYDCYKKPSEFKLDAELRIIHACRQMHGKKVQNFKLQHLHFYLCLCCRKRR